MIQARFQITLHEKDKAILELIKSNFGNIGYITSEIKDSLQYQISSLKDLTNVIIPHFERYPLITQKRADFELFKMVVEIMNRKENLTAEGLQAIINIRATLNWGLSTVLKQAFPNIVPVPRPLVVDQVIKSPH